MSILHETLLSTLGHLVLGAFTIRIYLLQSLGQEWAAAGVAGMANEYRTLRGGFLQFYVGNPPFT